MDINKYKMAQKKTFFGKVRFRINITTHASRTHMQKTNESHVNVNSMKEKYRESFEVYTLQNVSVKRSRCRFSVPRNIVHAINIFVIHM